MYHGSNKRLVQLFSNLLIPQDISNYTKLTDDLE